MARESKLRKKRMECVTIIQIFLMVGTFENPDRTTHGPAPIAVD
jgi:hypothetical protein